MLPRCLSQQVSESPSDGASPASRRRLVSYSPMAMNGPTSRQPLTSDITYSGLVRNNQPNSSAMAQKLRP